MTVRGQVYHYLCAMIAPNNFKSHFVSNYIHDTDYIQRGNKRAVKIPNLNLQLLQNPTHMLLEVNSHVQSLVAFQNWATPVDAPNSYRTIIHSDTRRFGEHNRRCIGPQTSEIPAIIPRTEDDIVDRQDVVVCRSGQYTETGTERFDTIPVTHVSYDPPYLHSHPS